MNRDWRGVILQIAAMASLVYIVSLVRDLTVVTMVAGGLMTHVIGQMTRGKVREVQDSFSLPPPSGYGGGGGPTLRVPPLGKVPLDPGGEGRASRAPGALGAALMVLGAGVIVAMVAIEGCGTPLAPKEVCVQWERAIDGGREGASVRDAGDRQTDIGTEAGGP